MEPVVEACNEFSVNLFKDLLENGQKNVACSTFSVGAAMTMVYLGAGGNTEIQMAKVLNFRKATEKKPVPQMEQTTLKTCAPAHLQNIPQAFEELFLAVNSPSNNYILKSANGVFHEKSFHTEKQYSQLIEKSFRAKIQAVDFVQNPEEGRKMINDWVEGKTEGKIKDILAQGSVDSLTKLVLVNALYFKGNWAFKFPEENTEQKPFRLSKTKSKPVPMMFQRNKFNMFYIESLETKVLELPYIKKEISLIIILPDEITDNSTGLEKIHKELTYENLREWTRADMMEKTEVELELPRFRLEDSYDLKSHLSKMGMTDLFDENKADLTGISQKVKTSVSQVFHKMFVEVNEEGTEAAAATAAVVTVRRRPIVARVQADHPFIFLLRHNQTRTIMFLGEFISP